MTIWKSVAETTLPAVAQAGQTIATTKGSSIASGVWTLVGLVVAGMFTTIGIALKKWDAWSTAGTARETAQQQGIAADFARLRDEVKSVTSQLHLVQTDQQQDRARHYVELTARDRRLAYERHKTRNILACVDQLLFILESSPGLDDRARRAIESVKQMRLEYIRAEERESEEMHAINEAEARALASEVERRDTPAAGS